MTLSPRVQEKNNHRDENSLTATIPSSPFKISNGTLEALKWIAVVAMTIDHANRFFFQSHLYTAYCIGRLALPLFAFIFAYNLTRPLCMEREFYLRVCERLTLSGMLAIPAFMAMKDQTSLLPLNIMFMFVIAITIIFLCEKKRGFSYAAALFIFLTGSMLVEYNWVGILICFSFWLVCKSPSLSTILFLLFTFFLLSNLNTNYWALGSLPLIVAATQIDLVVPRIRYLFYIYYPSHLILFWLITRVC